ATYREAHRNSSQSTSVERAKIEAKLMTCRIVVATEVERTTGYVRTHAIHKRAGAGIDTNVPGGEGIRYVVGEKRRRRWGPCRLLRGIWRRLSGKFTVEIPMEQQFAVWIPWTHGICFPCETRCKEQEGSGENHERAKC